MSRRTYEPPAPGCIHVVPLGGVGEIGKNMWCIRTATTVVILDCGFAFPGPEMYGVDVVIPDYAYVEALMPEVSGVFISHAHEDHVGGLPYFLQRVMTPVYGTALTLGLVETKLGEHGLGGRVPLRRIDPGEHVVVGDMEIEFIHVTHSVAGAVAIAVHTPVGTVLYTGDFKLDPTPIDEQPSDLARLKALGDAGVLLLLSDSTNVNRKGSTPSEATVGPTLERVFAEAPGRLVVTTFASNIHRVQQTLDIAARHQRVVAFMGRSMLRVSQVAHDLGYLKYDPKDVVELDDLKGIPPENILLLTTGSQGEPMAALARLASQPHKGISLGAGDTVFISAVPIPGNERSVSKVINQLLEKGAQVIYEGVRQGTHVSGHGSEDELAQMLALIRPLNFIPCHGETRHLTRHAALALTTGVPADRILIAANGDIIQVGNNGLALVDRAPGGPVMVDGDARWLVDGGLLRERERLASDGVVTTVLLVDGNLEILGGPEMLARGFVHATEAEQLLDEGKRRVVEVVDGFRARGMLNPERLKPQIIETLARYFSEKTRRRPYQQVIIQQV